MVHQMREKDEIMKVMSIPRIIWIALLLFVVAPGGVLAAFTSEKVLEDEERAVFFVSYQRGKATRGGLLDTEKKARRKLEKRSEELCAERGYSYMKFPSLAEIALDEELRAIWDVAVGDQEKNSTATSGNMWSGTVTAHKSRDLLLLSRKPHSGWLRCGYGPPSPSPAASAGSSPAPPRPSTPTTSVGESPTSEPADAPSNSSGTTSPSPQVGSSLPQLTVKTSAQKIRDDIWLISASAEVREGQRVDADALFKTALAEVCEKTRQTSYRRLGPVDIAQDEAVRAVWAVLGAAYGQPVEKELGAGNVEVTSHEIVEFGDSKEAEPCLRD